MSSTLDALSPSLRRIRQQVYRTALWMGLTSALWMMVQTSLLPNPRPLELMHNAAIGLLLALAIWVHEKGTLQPGQLERTLFFFFAGSFLVQRVTETLGLPLAGPGFRSDWLLNVLSVAAFIVLPMWTALRVVLALLGLSVLLPLGMSLGLGLALSLPLLLGQTVAALILALLVFALAFYQVRLAEEKARNHILERQAHSDALTQLPNRRALYMQLEAVLPSPPPCSVVLLDLDHFKRINDTHGHGVGDEVLRSSARILEEVLRAGEVLGRWGGEEFLVVMPGLSLEAALERAETLRRALEHLHCPPVDRITASLGVAERLPAEPLELWLQRADSALYEAKHQGRNRVRSWIGNSAGSAPGT